MASLSRAFAMMLALTVLLSGLSGCEDTGRAGAAVAPVKIKGKTFFLEAAIDAGTRTKGLGERTHIEDDGGMLFAFPGKEEIREFVMRDCPIPIDVIFTDGSGRVVASHAMLPEPPRTEKEGKSGTPVYAYEVRLKRYSSKFPSVFAIELQGGMIAKLGVKDGDKLEFDAAGLKAKAR